MKVFIILLFMASFMAGCSKELSNQDGALLSASLELRFVHQVGSQPLVLGSAYQNSFGENFTVSRFKYYVSNIALNTVGNTGKRAESYFLVDESDSASAILRMPISPGDYSQLSFLLGVDSTRNVSGAQTGALDPLHDMFWTWNTGYIMMKLEGSSPLSSQPNNRVQYHIGGFSGAYSALRQINTGFVNPVAVKGGQTLVVTYRADLERWFSGVHDLPIANQAVTMSPGPLAASYADNGASMFSVIDAAVQ